MSALSPPPLSDGLYRYIYILIMIAIYVMVFNAIISITMVMHTLFYMELGVIILMWRYVSLSLLRSSHSEEKEGLPGSQLIS